MRRRLTASRFVRFDTGSNKLEVFASHTAAIANGIGARRNRVAIASTTGVSSTAVVSRLNTIVVSVPSSNTIANSHGVRPRAVRAARTAATSKTCAASANSATTVIATRKPRIGPTRCVVATASCQGRAPIATQMPPASAAINHTVVAYGGGVPHRRVRLVADGARLREGFAGVRAELGVPGPFPEPVVAAAEQAARRPRLPDRDLTDVGFVTIDPPGSMDLDQAMHIERRGAGYRVRYAIADVAAFVAPGDPVDLEAHLRGETLYSPDIRTPLHPPAVGEAAASLLPDQARPALVWIIDLDSDGRQTEADVVRAMVRSTARLDYEGTQARIGANNISDDDVLALLAEVGKLRQQLEIDRGAVSLRLPEQEVDPEGDGFRLSYRAPLPVEDWNAQISLLTGMAAAGVMLDAGVGILRTLPAPDQGAVDMLRRSAKALDVEWPKSLTYQGFVRKLDPATDTGAALLELSTRLLRGAGYTAFDGKPPTEAEHAAVAAPYAHATAPLRRLVDRYVGELCAAVCAGSPIPAWVREALPALPAVMAASDHRAHALERACVDLVETVLLAAHVGETFEATVVERNHRGGTVQLRRPPVRARCDGEGLPLGERVEVRLERADPSTRALSFALAYDGGTADEPAGRPRQRRETEAAEEGPGSTGQGGG